jgi:hypothetical protein
MCNRTVAAILVFFLCSFSIICIGQGSSAEEPMATKTCDSECLKKFVDQYMYAMLVNDPWDTLFAKDCKFTENGIRLPLGSEGLWASMVGQGTYKFYVPDVETQQIAFLGTAREEPQKEGDTPRPVAIALRLKIVNGLITEAEQLVVRPDTNILNPAKADSPPSAAENIEKMGKELVILILFFLRSFLKMRGLRVRR